MTVPTVELTSFDTLRSVLYTTDVVACGSTQRAAARPARENLALIATIASEVLRGTLGHNDKPLTDVQLAHKLAMLMTLPVIVRGAMFSADEIAVEREDVATEQDMHTLLASARAMFVRGTAATTYPEDPIGYAEGIMLIEVAMADMAAVAAFWYEHRGFDQ